MEKSAENSGSSRLRPLSGLRVLDFTSMIAGPLCTRFMADLGCDVIKIESAEGDYIRMREPMRLGHSAYFGHLNAGKRSMVLDLRQPDARRAVLQMVQHCDVIVENMRPGAMGRLGLDQASVSALNSRLVYCSISGFGQRGPDSNRPAYAPIVQAASGYESAAASYQGRVEGKPLNVANFVADILGGLFGLSGILAALQHRNVTGLGQHVDTSLFESMLHLMPFEVQEAQFPVDKPRPVYPPMRARDGYLMIAAISPRNIEALLDTIGIEGWREHALFRSEKSRQDNWDEVMRRVETWTMQRSCDECINVLGDAGVPITRYQTVRDAIYSPQAVFRHAMQSVHDIAGTYLVPNLPFKLSGADVSAGSAVPALGEHTLQVLSELTELDEVTVRNLASVERRDY